MPRSLQPGPAPPFIGAAPAISRSGGKPLTVDERVPLSLTADRGRLGLDLTSPIEVGPLTVERLVLVFGNLRFPVDLSGGVPAFRHRRGELERITISAELERLKCWVTPKLRAVLGELERPIDLWLTETGVRFGWSRHDSAVTGELYWAPFGDTARFVLGNVRGYTPKSPVLAEVLRSVDAVLAGYFERRGRAWLSAQVGRNLSRLLLPAAGARAPSVTGVTFGSLLREDGRVRTRLDVQLTELALCPDVVRAIELSELALKADDALARGNLEEARREYLRALEYAPRQKDLVLAVAELDLVAGNREHAALGMLTDAMPAIAAGVLGAELLRCAGDRMGALEALDAAIRNELYAPLRALLLLNKAQLETDASLRKAAIDAAIGVAPILTSARWARLELRAATGDSSGVIEDADFLDSAVLGAVNKFQVWIRCGFLLQRSGLAKSAARCFERALRYCPDDPDAAVGLAKSFIDSHQPMRAVSLLERAVHNGPESSPAISESLLLLAQILAKEVNDIPEAIARLRQIPAGTTVATEARAAEARWRHVLGDIVGASVAWARMREAIELGYAPAAAVKWLREAAQFEREVRRDLPCAERHLATALRIAPQDQLLTTLYREIAAALAVEREQSQPSSVSGTTEDER